MAVIEMKVEVPDDNCVRPTGAQLCRFSNPRGLWCFCTLFDEELEVSQHGVVWSAKPCAKCLKARKSTGKGA